MCVSRGEGGVSTSPGQRGRPSSWMRAFSSTCVLHCALCIDCPDRRLLAALAWQPQDGALTHSAEAQRALRRRCWSPSAACDCCGRSPDPLPVPLEHWRREQFASMRASAGAATPASLIGQRARAASGRRRAGWGWQRVGRRRRRLPARHRQQAPSPAAHKHCRCPPLGAGQARHDHDREDPGQAL